MKGRGTSCSPLYAGLRTDIEKLLDKVVKRNSVRYEEFQPCFREMRFSLIYSGRTTENEMREFAEKLLSMTATYCFEPYSLQTRIGAVYLLYALFYLQSKKQRTQIRVTSGMFDQLGKFFEYLKQNNHWDTCFTLVALFQDGAFCICKFLDEHNPLTFRKYEAGDQAEQPTESLRTKRTAVKDILNDLDMDTLDALHEIYIDRKTAMLNGQLPEDVSLVTTVDVSSLLKSAVGELAIEAEKERCEEQLKLNDDTDTKKLGAKRARIRERAFKAETKSGRRGKRTIKTDDD